MFSNVVCPAWNTCMQNTSCEVCSSQTTMGLGVCDHEYLVSHEYKVANVWYHSSNAKSNQWVMLVHALIDSIRAKQG